MKLYNLCVSNILSQCLRQVMMIGVMVLMKNVLSLSALVDVRERKGLAKGYCHSCTRECETSSMGTFHLPIVD